MREPLVVVLDPDGRILLWNRACSEVSGYDFEEVRGRKAGELKPSSEGAETTRRMLAQILSGKPIPPESLVVTKEGEHRWIAWSAQVSRLPDGRPEFIYLVGVDRTGAKLAEEALRTSEATFAGIVSIALDAIISVDGEQHIVIYNEGAESIFGWRRDEVLGKPLDLLIPARFRDIHRKHMHEFAAGPERSRRMGEHRPSIFGLRKNGQEFPAEAAISKMEVGEKVFFNVVLRDITYRARLERNQRFLAEVGTVLSTTLDYQEVLTLIAQLAVRFLADTCILDLEEEGLVRRLRVVHRDPARMQLATALEHVPLDRSRPSLDSQVFETKRPMLVTNVSAEFLQSVAQGPEHLELLRQLHPASLMGFPLLAHGRLLGVLLLVSSNPHCHYEPEDLRLGEELAHRAALAVDNARLYRAAQQAIAARDEVLGIVAHDLRNPLHAVGLAAASLRHKVPQDGMGRAIHKTGESIQRCIDQANRLIEDLLDVARIEQQGLHIERGRVAPGELMAEVTPLFTAAASNASLELWTELPEMLPQVMADRDRILQVFSNLLGNAVKFTPPGGRIRVGAELRDSEVCFLVADTGKGIAPAHLSRLFDRFWKERPTDRRGAGLGLYIAKGIIEAHGGRIWAESTLGQGTTFFFTLPIAPGIERNEKVPASMRAPR
ncbi:PAS domain-containing sensor histidine kinase [Archangium lansingense]|uniref:histidine kinase n=1 Tax=Archangium lansingense TaxID=2995310 RepID=A0ABT3ZYC0_9BACT|nr:PAS domain S-box protein [Archangium lansinium]MCY1074403.1 PAS domain S-box protein [Archangium lansinium]